jgi:hypothetical protein
MGHPAVSADPQPVDRFAVDYDRYASLEPPLVMDWLLTQLPAAAAVPVAMVARRTATVNAASQLRRCAPGRRIGVEGPGPVS